MMPQKPRGPGRRGLAATVIAMAIPKKVKTAIAGDLEAGEQLVAGVRGQQPGFAWVFAAIIGFGAFVAISNDWGVLTTALAGGAAGAVIAALGAIWARGRPPLRALYAVFAATDRRLLCYPLNLWGVPTSATVVVPLSQITNVSVAPKRWIFPRKLSLSIEGLGTITLAVGFVDDAEEFGRALRA
jgi:hypothetical protein